VKNQPRGVPPAVRICAILVFSLIFLSSLPLSSARVPDKGDHFTYKTEEFIENGHGEYYGYSEKTVGNGRYDVEANSAGNITVKYYYRWDYSSDTEPPVSGIGDDRIWFDQVTRGYTRGFDLDQKVSSPATVWFWIYQDVQQGDVVQLLDENFTVTGTDVTIWSNMVPYKAIELTATGAFSRSDDYGDFYATYTDRYYFDSGSGYIIAERYTEYDSGLYEGETASFDWKFNFDVSETSYKLSVDWGLVALFYVTIPAAILLLIGAAAYGIRWRPHTVYLVNDRAVKLRRIWRRSPFPWDTGKATGFFGPFMRSIVDKSRAANDRVAVALDHGQLVGVAIHHTDVKVGSMFAPDKYVNEALRRFVRTKDFFSETRHMDTIGQNAVDVYNIYETHKILVARKLGPMAFDNSAVRPMTAADMPAVRAISRKVYRTSGRKWYPILLEMGDIGLVAVADGKIAGYAFATVAGDWARFHTLTVSPEFRGRGLGKELMRARLSMAYHLGAKAAMVEIAEWNLPSMRISTSLGFVQEGWMFVESARRHRKQRTIVRR
jgi:GNAT superfamily N-acetyltransferase